MASSSQGFGRGRNVMNQQNTARENAGNEEERSGDRNPMDEDADDDYPVRRFTMDDIPADSTSESGASGNTEGNSTIPVLGLQGNLTYDVSTMDPLEMLNQCRARIGLGPSRNLMASGNELNSVKRLTLQEDQIVAIQQKQNAKSQEAEKKDTEQTSVANMGQLAIPRPVGLASSFAAEELNCRLWITGLPAQCTISRILGCIRNIGPVFACTVFQTPASDPQGRITSSASLTFFAAEAANMFLQMQARYPFVVDGHRTTVVRHRFRADPVPIDGRSRVVRITGSADLVNPEALFAIFKERNIHFDTDFLQFSPSASHGQNEIIWAFGSFQGQASTLYEQIRWNIGNNCRANVEYLRDPCA